MIKRFNVLHRFFYFYFHHMFTPKYFRRLNQFTFIVPFSSLVYSIKINFTIKTASFDNIISDYSFSFKRTDNSF